MKYENFEDAAEIVKQIKALEEKHNAINPQTCVLIYDGLNYASKVYDISVLSDVSHQYAPQASDFLADIKTDLRQRINVLKEQLSKL